MSERTRRELLRDGAAVGAAGVFASYGMADATKPRRRARRRVAVLGGGVGG